MHDAATPPAIWVRHGTLWRPFDRALVASRVHEYAGGLLEVGCASESIFALEHNTDSESLLLLIAALEIGVTIRLGTADTPFAAGFATTPIRAAHLASLARLDSVCVPVAPREDSGRSLERLAAHGVLHTALRTDAVRERTRERHGHQRALITSTNVDCTLGQLHTDVTAFRAAGDLLRPDETILITVPLDTPWSVTVALAAVEQGIPVAIGRLEDIPLLKPSVVVGTAADADALAETTAGGPTLLTTLSRHLGRSRTAPPPRCLIVGDHEVPTSVCSQLHLGGTTVQQLAADADGFLLPPRVE